MHDQQKLFQSTLPREERPLISGNTTASKNFNPRSHERSDDIPRRGTRIRKKYFNPRSHERSDQFAASLKTALFLFQSTLPREERHVRMADLEKDLDFNPRSHERSDKNWLNIGDQIMLFQSTLPREERPKAFCDGVLAFLFQSTLPREERQCLPQ